MIDQQNWQAKKLNDTKKLNNTIMSFEKKRWINDELIALKDSYVIIISTEFFNSNQIDFIKEFGYIKNLNYMNVHKQELIQNLVVLIFISTDTSKHY